MFSIVTIGSMAAALLLMKKRSLTWPASIGRVRPAAMTATASAMVGGSPAIRLKSLAVPSGTMPKGTVGPSPAARSRPLMTSLIVPSPPAAITAS